MPYANTFQIFPRDWIFLNIQSAISAIRLQSYIAVSGLHLDYTERKIQSLGNVLKVLAHGVHQAVRFTWV